MPITERNEFFNPDDFDYQVEYFMEEVVKVETNKFLGFRRLPGLPTRPLGSPGRAQTTLTENITVTRGGRTFTVKASKKKPLLIEGMIFAVGGR